MKMENVYSMCIIITIVSFLGFCVENIWLAATKGYIDNRNMWFPFLLGYGLAVAAIYMMFGTPASPRIFAVPLNLGNAYLNTLVYFLFVCACVMLGEILLGTFVEKTTSIVWWDYSALHLHITKYTSVPTTLAFSAMITLFMRYIFAPLYAKMAEIQGRAFAFIALALMLLMVVDFIHSGIRMFQTHELMRVWRVELRAPNASNCADGGNI